MSHRLGKKLAGHPQGPEWHGWTRPDKKFPRPLLCCSGARSLTPSLSILHFHPSLRQAKEKCRGEDLVCEERFFQNWILESIVICVISIICVNVHLQCNLCHYNDITMKTVILKVFRSVGIHNQIMCCHQCAYFVVVIRIFCCCHHCDFTVIIVIILMSSIWSVFCNQCLLVFMCSVCCQ